MQRVPLNPRPLRQRRAPARDEGFKRNRLRVRLRRSAEGCWVGATPDFGEPSVEDVIGEAVEASLAQLVRELRAENEALKARVRALESLHAYRAGPPIVFLRRAR
jgi:hypothetical protein